MDELPLPGLPDRDPKGHKGTFGTVVVIGGCASTRPGMMRMIGAPVLSARGAARSGAGLVRLLMPSPIIDAGVSMLPNATGISLPVDEHGDVITHEAAAELDRQFESASAMVIGPGLGSPPPGSGGCASLVLRAIQQDKVPIVLDADGLNLLSKITEFWRDIRAPLIVTPHPGEYRRLAQAVGVDGDPIDVHKRPLAAEMLAQRLGAIVVLKGAGTVVSDGHRTWTCTRGHSCLATGGTGDVLAGVIAGLVSQFTRHGSRAGQEAAQSEADLAKIPEKYRAAMAKLNAKVAAGKNGSVHGDAEAAASTAAHGAAHESAKLDLFDCARWAVQLHAIAAERWAQGNGDAGLLAHELADLIPGVMHVEGNTKPF
jgi:ADP-dependent NAD(P)H-hydrate dehydratase